LQDLLLRATCRPYCVVGGRTGDIPGRPPSARLRARALPRNIADKKELARMKVDVIVAAAKYLRYLMRREMATL
jgi:hypothetical protein